ncbi:MAG: hypothetical protein ABIH37_00785 [archaeon]
MDKGIPPTYTYAAGSADQLRTRDSSLTTIEKPIRSNLAKHLKSNGAVVLPNFVGVYQDEQCGPDNPYPELREAALRLKEGLVGLLDVLDGIELNPKLIHIIYKGETWDESLIRQCLGDKERRLAVSRLGQTPNFSKKDTDVFLELLKIEPGGEHPDKGKYIKQLQTQQKTYGLTKDEYFILGCHTGLFGRNSLITDSEHLAMAGEILEVEGMRY